MKANSLAAIIVAVLVIIVGIAAFTRGPAQAPSDQNTENTDGGNFTPTAVVSPEIQGNLLSVGGQQHWQYRFKLTNASTTCIARSPAATSTFSFGGFLISSSSASASIWELGYSVGIDATTTLIGTAFSVAANQLANVVASTTQSTGAVILGPNTWVSLKRGYTTGNVGVVGGFCDMNFNVL